jgi:tetratricopeptide (TPR) repeat protein
MMIKSLVILAAVCLASAGAQPPEQRQTMQTPQHEANFDAERKQANDLFLAGEILKSLPLYEDLCRSAISGFPLSVGYLYHGSAEAQPVMKEAAAAFGREDLAGALKLYLRAAQMDPKWYDAALYSGDTYFRQGDMDDAGIWYTKAIAIDPDRDTAYRYWGDALMKAGSRTWPGLSTNRRLWQSPTVSLAGFRLCSGLG